MLDSLPALSVVELRASLVRVQGDVGRGMAQVARIVGSLEERVLWVVEAALGRLNLVSRVELRRLNERIVQLEHRIDKLAAKQVAEAVRAAIGS